MHRGLKSLLLAAPLGVVALAGCSAPSAPQVTFYSHGEAIEVAPARFCDATGENCAPPAEDPVGKLRVPEKSPLQISVPGEVSATPWQVSYIYRGVDGQEVEGRTGVIRPDERHSYTLRIPPDGTRLEHVEVQQYSGLLVLGEDGGVDFPIAATWVIDPT
ncbi:MULTISPECIES: DUF2771 family protein [unclassified Saccharopolyspora]|uniref:DUF2771 family protein n=1 Tax=unclassified Saccharopolyspora TaxID=2646250 RepID=UPI001CD5E06F|nr:MULTISPECIES: DUF2771 family protein [unclassified Saccharopolyspora]MCA1186449.1 DUF2771 domain-containing protein [Saccharopolyspora sp. 6T]MCA1193564.1 DUF2771 domain-containing protein [Saccharopolyspora sp. 6V]MCA1280071.1 DUF2771 domain-containing protein [Saccharopolyspora sp. 7B]